MKKRVLQISNRYSPVIGGTERTCQYLSEGIKNKYDVTVICFCESKKNKIENINGVVVYKAALFTNIFRQPISFSYFRILHKLIKEWQPDLIHFHVPNPFVAVLLLPILPKQTKLYLHWHLDITTQRKIYPIFKPIEKKLLNRANIIATTSPNYKLSSIPLRNFSDKVVVLPSAIDTTKLNLNDSDIKEIEEIREQSNRRSIVFFAGRHVLHKGVHLLLEAADKLESDCVIYIAGSGPITNKIKQKYNLRNIIFLGDLSDDELKHFYYAADIFAFPSYTRSEAFGLALAEAMYCKTAVATFSIEGSGVNWVSLNNITGIEVENSNVKEFAKAIDKLIANDALREEYAKNGRQRVINEFTIEKEIGILLSQYDSLLNT